MNATIFLLLALLLQSGRDLYQQGLIQENAAGNLEAAIQLYRDAARNAAGDRALAVQALMAEARCYEKLGQSKALEIYDDIARSYSDQQQQAALARQRAAALQHSNEPLQVAPPPNSVDHLVSVAPGMFWQPLQQLPKFDLSKPITVSGTVTRVEWSNPSTNLSIEAKSGNGERITYRVYGANPNRLVQEGFTRATIRLGDVITVDGFAGDAPSTIGNATLTLGDGRRLSFGMTVSGASAPR
jgi:tetratricopeptide (TPR) repeat protein